MNSNRFGCIQSIQSRRQAFIIYYYHCSSTTLQSTSACTDTRRANELRTDLSTVTSTNHPGTPSGMSPRVGLNPRHRRSPSIEIVVDSDVEEPVRSSDRQKLLRLGKRWTTNGRPVVRVPVSMHRQQPYTLNPDMVSDLFKLNSQNSVFTIFKK